MRTLNQERSEYALKKVLEIQEIKNKEFKNFSAGLPSMILKNGFGHTLAFWLSKGKDHHIKAFEIVRDWLIDKDFINSNRDNGTFLEKLSTITQNQYIEAQKESLKLLEWVKRYAQAFLESDK